MCERSLMPGLAPPSSRELSPCPLEIISSLIFFFWKELSLNVITF